MEGGTKRESDLHRRIEVKFPRFEEGVLDRPRNRVVISMEFETIVFIVLTLLVSFNCVVLDTFMRETRRGYLTTCAALLVLLGLAIFGETWAFEGIKPAISMELGAIVIIVVTLLVSLDCLVLVAFMRHTRRRYPKICAVLLILVVVAYLTAGIVLFATIVVVLLVSSNCLAVVTIMTDKRKRDLTIHAVLLCLLTLAFLTASITLFQIRLSFRELLENLSDFPPELGDGVFGLLSINSRPCQLKSVCEISKIISSKRNGFRSFPRIIANFMDVESEFLLGAARGSLGMNCSSLYLPCEQRFIETFPFIEL